MRGADTFTENLFTMRRLEDLVPADHPLRPNRVMVIQAWAGHKSLVRQDGSDGAGANSKGKTRCNDTHACTTDPDARLYRKSNTPSELRFMGHALTDNRHGLMARVVFTTADGHAEREAAKALISDACQALDDPAITLTLGADKGYDAQVFIEALQPMNVTPHAARNTSGRSSAVHEAVTQIAGYAVTQQKRKLIEQGFGWAKAIGGIPQVLVRGLKKVDQVLVLTMAGYNLTHMRTLGQVRVQGT